jgi:hypothetical protein
MAYWQAACWVLLLSAQDAQFPGLTSVHSGSEPLSRHEKRRHSNRKCPWGWLEHREEETKLESLTPAETGLCLWPHLSTLFKEGASESFPDLLSLWVLAKSLGDWLLLSCRNPTPSTKGTSFHHFDQQDTQWALLIFCLNTKPYLWIWSYSVSSVECQAWFCLSELLGIFPGGKRVNLWEQIAFIQAFRPKACKHFLCRDRE